MSHLDLINFIVSRELIDLAGLRFIGQLDDIEIKRLEALSKVVKTLPPKNLESATVAAETQEDLSDEEMEQQARDALGG